MNNYEKVDIEVVYFENNDVFANSLDDAVDDLGGWNGEWFPQKND